VPGVGDAIKAGIRGSQRAIDAGTEVAQGAARRVDDVGEVGAKENVATTNAETPRFVAIDGGVTIDRMAVNATVSAQRQGRHVLGARQYQGGSYFTSADDAQRVLDAFHSRSAEILGVKGSDIVVRVPEVTGFNVNPGAGFPNQATNVFFIKGTSSPSVVPHNPEWKP
jgi:hypothetical protein